MRAGTGPRGQDTTKISAERDVVMGGKLGGADRESIFRRPEWAEKLRILDLKHVFLLNFGE